MKYPSRYNPGKESNAAQYITELVCEKKALKELKDLPPKFWKLPEWKKFYQQQIVAANSLLKVYSETIIIKVLMDPAMKFIYSLRAPQLIDRLTIEQAKSDSKPKIENTIKIVDKDSKPRPSRIKDNIISKLEELE